MAHKPLNFLIVHGTCGHPEGNWFLWLKQELESQGHTVLIPRFPTPEGQTFSAWRTIALKAVEALDPEQTVLVGHSIGAAFVLRLAEEAAKPYRAVFAVCPFVRPLGLKDFDPFNETFVAHAFDWARIKNNAARIFCFAGTDDPYVPLSLAEEVSEKAGAVLERGGKGGHLNEESSYRAFPLLLDKINALAQA